MIISKKIHQVAVFIALDKLNTWLVYCSEEGIVVEKITPVCVDDSIEFYVQFLDEVSS